MSNEGGRRRAGRAPRSTPTAPHVPANPLPRHLDDRHRQRHRHRGPVRRRSASIASGCTRPRCTSPDTRCSSPTPTSDTVSVIDTGKDEVVQTIETKPWPSSNVGYAAHRHRADQGRPPARLPRPRERGRRLPLRRRPAGAGRATSACCRPTTTRATWRRSATRSSSPTPAASTRAARSSRSTRAPAPGRDRSRHPQHDRVADALHAAERQGDRRPYTTTVFAQNGWGTTGRPAGRRASRRAAPCRSRRGSVTRRRSSTSS